MSYLVDTNVLSELRRKQPQPEVVAWFAQRPRQTLYLSVLTLGEIRKGIEKLDAARQQPLLDWLEVELPNYFLGRLLAVDAHTADRWGRLLASAALEILLSALLAPITMVTQAAQFVQVLRGRDWLPRACQPSRLRGLAA